MLARQHLPRTFNSSAVLTLTFAEHMQSFHLMLFLMLDAAVKV